MIAFLDGLKTMIPAQQEISKFSHLQMHPFGVVVGFTVQI